MTNKTEKIMHYEKVDQDGKFELYLKQPITTLKQCEVGHFVNKYTGEDVGQYKELYTYYYDKNFNLLETPIEEEDCYEYTAE